MAASNTFCCCGHLVGSIGCNRPRDSVSQPRKYEAAFAGLHRTIRTPRHGLVQLAEVGKHRSCRIPDADRKHARNIRLQALSDGSGGEEGEKTWSIEEILAEAEAEGPNLVFAEDGSSDDEEEEFMRGPSIETAGPDGQSGGLPSGDDMTRILSAYGEAEDERQNDITVDALRELLQSPSPRLLLDVRSEQEYKSGHVPGAIHLPLDSLVGRIAAGEVDIKDKPLAAICASGGRSARAVLELKTFCQAKDVVNVKGGTSAWIDAGYPVER